MANPVTRLLASPSRLFLFLLLLGGLRSVQGRLGSAIQSNRAFVAANRLPSLFTLEGDMTALATVEARLHDVLAAVPARRSARRMLSLVRHARAGGETQLSTLSAAELIWWGRQKEQLGDGVAARYLFEWAAQQTPEAGDAWYYLGQLYRQQQDPAAALQALRRATAAPVWYNLGRSDAHLALANLYGEEALAAHIESAIESYREALKLDDFGTIENRARAHYALAELLLWQKDDPAAAATHYAAALAITPDDHWARLRLGYTHYYADGDVEKAEREILTAIAQWPDEKYLRWPYFYLGEIYEQAGMSSEAASAYEQVLALDPSDTRTRLRLARLRSP